LVLKIQPSQDLFWNFKTDKHDI